MNVDDIVQIRIADAARKVEATKKRRAEMDAARQRGLAQRHATKLRRQAGVATPQPTKEPDMSNALKVLDEAHEEQLRDPQFDPKDSIEKGLKNALTILVDALSMTDKHPNRVEYAAQLAEAHADDPDPVVEMLDTVVAWLQDARSEQADDDVIASA